MNHRELEQAYANLVNENKKLTQEIERLHTMIKDNMSNPVYISGPDGKLIAVTPDNMRTLVDEIVKLQPNNKQVFDAISYNK